MFEGPCRKGLQKQNLKINVTHLKLSGRREGLPVNTVVFLGRCGQHLFTPGDNHLLI